MTTAAEILRSKPDPAVYTIEPTASVFEAARLMAEKNIGALVVVEGEDGSSASSANATMRAR